MKGIYYGLAFSLPFWGAVLSFPAKSPLPFALGIIAAAVLVIVPDFLAYIARPDDRFDVLPTDDLKPVWPSEIGGYE